MLKLLTILFLKILTIGFIFAFTVGTIVDKKIAYNKYYIIIKPYYEQWVEVGKFLYYAHSYYNWLFHISFFLAIIYAIYLYLNKNKNR